MLIIYKGHVSTIAGRTSRVTLGAAYSITIDEVNSFLFIATRSKLLKLSLQDGMGTKFYYIEGST